MSDRGRIEATALATTHDWAEFVDGPSFAAFAPTLQGDFLRFAMRELNLDQAGLAQRLSISGHGMAKWLCSPDGGDFRKMSAMAWRYLSEILTWDKPNGCV